MTKFFVRWCRGGWTSGGLRVASCVSQMQTAVRSRAHLDINIDNGIVHHKMPPGNLAAFDCCNMRA